VKGGVAVAKQWSECGTWNIATRAKRGERPKE